MSSASPFTRFWFVLLAVLLVGGVTPIAPAQAADDKRPVQPSVQPNMVVVKLKPGLTGLGKGALFDSGTMAKAQSILQTTSIDPLWQVPEAGLGKGGQQLKGLETLRSLYVMRYAAQTDPYEAAARLMQDPRVAYAEPMPIHTIHGSAPALTAAQVDEPEDDLFPQMTHLRQVLLPEAWEVVKAEQGKNNNPEDRVVIAIADGGTDWRHPDLINNIWQNLDEDADGDGRTIERIDGEWQFDPDDLDGIDNDDNSYVDDLIGWNFPSDVNDPTGLTNTPLNASHGTNVAGVASAESNNGIGISGAAWNALLMPLNVASSDVDRAIAFGYSGILYAAFEGADIVNCSWGGPGLFQAARDIVDFATINGTLVVSSAGNGNSNNDVAPQSPASYPNALSVGATVKASDVRADFSNYGRTVNVFAPGSDLDTTNPNGGYTIPGRGANGTSFSSPLTAGVAALVKTLYPDWSPADVREHLMNTSDLIDDANATFLNGRLGRGRVNAFRAVTEPPRAAVRLVDVTFDDENGDGDLRSGETVQVLARVTSYLGDASNIQIGLLEGDRNVIPGEAVTLASLTQGDTVEVSVPMSISPNAPVGYTATLILSLLTEDDVQNYDVFNALLNPGSTRNHDTGTLQVSMTSSGNIGWTTYDNNTSIGQATSSRGTGFIYPSPNGVRNLLFEGGLVMGTGSSRISDAVRNNSNQPVGPDNVGQDKDFSVVPGRGLASDTLSGQADQKITVELRDSGAPSPIGVNVFQESFANTAEDQDDFVVVRYTVTNTQATDISNFHAGLFLDYDLNLDAVDFASYDPERRMGIMSDQASGGGVLVGAMLLSESGAVNYRSVDNPNEIYGGDAGDGFTSREKFQFLSGGIQTTTLPGTDAGMMMASGPYAFRPECSIEVAFALVGGSSQAELQTNADAARDFYNTNIRTSSNAPNSSPVFSETPEVPFTVEEGGSLSYEFQATDSDACDALRFGLEDAPLNARIGAGSGLFTFTPGFDQSGTYPFTVTVTDGRQVRRFETSVTVSNTNRAPSFTATAEDTLITSAQTLSLALNVSDPDDDAVTFSLATPLANAEVSSSGGGAGVFTFSPSPEQLGTFPVTIEATDGEETIQVSFSVDVIAPDFKAEQPFPNPGTTFTVPFQLPAPGTATLVIYDMLGREVKTLIDGSLNAGPHQPEWDGRNNAGQVMASGLYFARLEVSADGQTFQATNTIMLAR